MHMCSVYNTQNNTKLIKRPGVDFSTSLICYVSVVNKACNVPNE